MKSKNQKQVLSQEEVPSSPWLGEYTDCFTFKVKPITQAFVERFSADLVKWAYGNNEALIVSQFYLGKGISPQTYYRWVGQHQALKEAHETAKLCIGNRREIGALKRKFSEVMVTRRQHAYDAEWEADKQRAKQDRIDVAIGVKKAEKDSGERHFNIITNCFKDHTVDTEPCKKISYTTNKSQWG